VVDPVYNDAKDADAVNIIAGCFPSRTIIPIGAIDFIWGFGTLHCLSQQIPE
jgi:agmatine deiminase